MVAGMGSAQKSCIQPEQRGGVRPATFGSISVPTTGGTATSATNFTVAPRVTEAPAIPR